MISPSNQINQAYTTNVINIRGGREGAMAYPIQIGYTALLLDEENKMFFIKKNDPSGVQVPLREFKFEEITPTSTSETDSSKYVTKEDFNMLLAKIDKLEKSQSHRSNNYKQRRNNGNGQFYAKPDAR